jgi:ABC-2 type transport system permease protein
MNISALIALVRKDLQLFFQDGKAVALSFVVPIAIASFFGFLFGGNSSQKETAKIRVRVVDLDGSAISRKVTAGLAGDKALAVTSSPLAEARESVRKGKTAVAVVLPKGFGAASGQALFRPDVAKPEVELLYDPSHSAEQGMVRGFLTQYVMEAVSQEMFSGTQGQEMMDQSLRDLESDPAGLPAGRREPLQQLLQGARELNRLSRESPPSGTESAAPAAGAPGFSMPFTVKEEAVTARKGQKYNSYAHSFAGMGIQFILFGAIEIGVGILLERQRGLWKRVRSAPISRALLLLGKAASSTVISLLTLGVSFGFAMAVFGIRIEGTWLGFLGILLASSLMAATLGLLIAAIGKTPQAARGVSTFVVLFLVMLGGAWVPAFLFPAWLQKITLFIPTRWAVDGLDSVIWRGVDFAGSLTPIGILLGFALLFGGLAWTRFRWEEG